LLIEARKNYSNRSAKLRKTLLVKGKNKAVIAVGKKNGLVSIRKKTGKDILRNKLKGLKNKLTYSRRRGKVIRARRLRSRILSA